ncbi:Pre-mRNA-processing protein 40A [Zostera marina]|uniref:Pre-mRNA-processing protein 40A n=1 Tax=Zostera marina TaxID=29655 RepID=A0A0K9PNW3_ZOSMR|nr:Pre-mRNA-processing protein 40A [Zostera marina]
MANNPQAPGGSQFIPVAPSSQSQQFIPANSQPFRPVGNGMSMPVSNMGMPSGQLPPHYHQMSQQYPPRPGQQALQGPSSTQGGIPMPYIPPNVATSYGSLQHSSTSQTINNHTYQNAPAVSGSSEIWGLSSGAQSIPPIAPSVHSVQPPSSVSASTMPSNLFQQSSDWQEHTASDGKRYYYNKKTSQSSWEKPFDLMTPLEKADASTVWKEFTTPEGRKYYYNKLTKQSKWTIPDELRLAREQAEKEAVHTGEIVVPSVPSNLVNIPPSEKTATTGSITGGIVPISANSASFTALPVVSSTSIPTSSTLGGLPNLNSPATADSTFEHASPPVFINALKDASATITEDNTLDPKRLPDVVSHLENKSHEVKGSVLVTGKASEILLEEKSNSDGLYVYASKQEAKNAFKELLESANVESDWSWEQAMKLIVNDKRYDALRTIGERKQAFNEYLRQRKKTEVEERRIKYKKAREDFIKMLEECEQLTPLMQWRKVESLFEDDERLKAIERLRDREDLFDTYLKDLQKKEKLKAFEDHKRITTEYRSFLESCDFIKVNTRWRKVHNLRDDDERCSSLDKIEQLEIFQGYIHDLEKEEEEQKKIEMQQLRRQERKNRDEFRRLMEDHISAGTLTAKTHWGDYCMKVRGLSPYLDVASNTSGSTPKDLFDDTTKELETQYHDDKTQIKDALKMGKITLASRSTFEDFKSSISMDNSLEKISEINMKLVFEELLERLREKLQKLGDNFADLLYSIKDINASSYWDECKLLFEECQEYISLNDESYAREVFEEYIAHLQEKAKLKAKREKGREEKEKEKERREREKEADRSQKDDVEIENFDFNNIKEEKKREREKDRKHRKRHHIILTNDGSPERGDEPKKSKRDSDHKRSRNFLHGYTTDSDSEHRHRKHKKYHDGSHTSGMHEELEDGELGEDSKTR